MPLPPEDGASAPLSTIISETLNYLLNVIKFNEHSMNATHTIRDTCLFKANCDETRHQYHYTLVYNANYTATYKLLQKSLKHSLHIKKEPFST